jgi:hypothetical protein
LPGAAGRQKTGIENTNKTERNNIMAEEETKETIEVWGTKKPEGPVDKTKATKDQASPAEGAQAQAEVEGHWHFHRHHHHFGGPFWRVTGSGPGGGWVRCWNCGSVRFVRAAFPGQLFICGNCGAEYTPY